ncbi:DUF4190 domain-containing protein [Actinomadura sp. NPDC049753]|uniref:DUF4190 domain-containing protein n=1 Tax=Actinomadura sp. NPDC049753 TaxID=3154739 RepID=UPI003416B967
MSGYGGRPPSGWDDPYGGNQHWDTGGAYGQGYGYTQPGYGQPGYGYGPPGVPHRTTSNGSTIAALVCNAVAIVMCCNIVALPGLITAAVALGRVQTDPESARKLTIWSWSLFAASIVIGVALLIVYIVVGVMSDPDYGSSEGI